MFLSGFCGSDEFGPWEDSVISFCFLKTVLFYIVFFGFAAFGLLRLSYLKRHVAKSGHVATNLFKFKLACCGAFVLIAIIKAIIYLLRGLEPYEIVFELLSIPIWSFCIYLIYLEYYSMGLTQSWTVLGFWVSYYILDSVELQTIYVELERGNWEWAYYSFFIEYFLITSLVITGLWMNYIPAEYQKAQSDDEKSKFAMREGSYDKFRLEVQSPPSAQRKESPEDSVNIIYFLTFMWVTPLINYGFDYALQHTDLWELLKEDESKHSDAKFQAVWREELQKPNPSLIKSLIKVFGPSILITAFHRLVQDLSAFVGPVTLGYIITYIHDGEDPLWYGLLLVLIMFIGTQIGNVSSTLYFHRGSRDAIKVRGALTCAVYNKTFDLSHTARQEKTLGETVNIMAIDCGRYDELITILHTVWAGPLSITIAMVLLYRELGPSVFAGIATMLLLVPTNIYIVRLLNKLQKVLLRWKDQRSKIINEVLQGIRVVKYFAWETNFMKKIGLIREDELKTLRESSILQAVATSIWALTPVLVALSSFACYSILGNQLDSVTAFTALTLFDVLRVPVQTLPRVISCFVECRISSERIQSFLLSEEVDPNAVIFSSSEKKAIQVSNGTFYWDKTEDPSRDAVLKDMNISVPKGSLVAIVGSVGSGKSSFLQALLGNIYQTSDTQIKVSGSLAYVSQTAWIRNATVRENIISGNEFDEQRYLLTIQNCELEQDLEILPAGDMTEIGEKGINLSGGQKQRISIARAVYADKDIYLFDDPLSAVDPYVGRAIYHNCICGLLKDKTRVLVTHQIHYLENCYEILLLDNHMISDRGDYDHFVNGSSASTFFNSIKSTQSSHVVKEGEEEQQKDLPSKIKKEGVKNETKEKEKEKGKGKGNKEEGKQGGKHGIITKEAREIGGVQFKVYLNYLRSCGSVLLGLVLLFLFTSETATNIGTNFWLSYWSDHSASGEHSMKFYLAIYASFVFAQVVVISARQYLIVTSALNASRVMHFNLLKSVIYSPVQFFDTTPLGRILNRFSADIYTLDSSFPRTWSMVASRLFGAVGVFVVMCIITPFFLTALIPILYLYYRKQQMYLAASRELKRLNSITKSPIYSHFGETVAGVVTIKAFDNKDIFKEVNFERSDTNLKCYYSAMIANRWLGIWLKFFGGVVVAFGALFVVLERENLSPSFAGLAISYSLLITAILNQMTREFAELETQVVSVERVDEYCNLEQEGTPGTLDQSRDTFKSDSVYTSSSTTDDESSQHEDHWVKDGKIEFIDYSVKYRSDLPLVLKNISFKIKPREKIGIVGRTGSGKSTILMSLFRMIEAESGRIELDGKDVSKVPLRSLRRQIGIIPQDSILFAGTIRSNLDPFGMSSDKEIWRVLKKVCLDEFVKGLDLKLEYILAENADNLSAGQRQLMCLARALLKQCKILILDEATAAVDYETDLIIQKTLREEFKDVTVLTIAHRINTILDYDRVLVLNAGEVQEFGRPEELLKDVNGAFYSLVNGKRDKAKDVEQETLAEEQEL